MSKLVERGTSLKIEQLPPNSFLVAWPWWHNFVLDTFSSWCDASIIFNLILLPWLMVRNLHFKRTFGQYPAIHTNYTVDQTAPIYNLIIIFDAVLRQYAERKFWTRKIMNSTVLPYFHFGMNHQGFAAAKPTCLADASRKSENSSFWKDRIIVASTCRHSVQFGCYVTWVWMANYVYMMTRMLHFYISSPSLAVAGELCLRISCKLFLISWIRTLWEPSQ